MNEIDRQMRRLRDVDRMYMSQKITAKGSLANKKHESAGLVSQSQKAIKDLMAAKAQKRYNSQKLNDESSKDLKIGLPDDVTIKENLDGELLILSDQSTLSNRGQDNKNESATPKNEKARELAQKNRINM